MRNHTIYNSPARNHLPCRHGRYMDSRNSNTGSDRPRHTGIREPHSSRNPHRDWCHGRISEILYPNGIISMAPDGIFGPLTVTVNSDFFPEASSLETTVTRVSPSFFAIKLPVIPEIPSNQIISGSSISNVKPLVVAFEGSTVTGTSNLS